MILNTTRGRQLDRYHEYGSHVRVCGPPPTASKFASDHTIPELINCGLGVFFGVLYAKHLSAVGGGGVHVGVPVRARGFDGNGWGPWGGATRVSADALIADCAVCSPPWPRSRFPAGSRFSALRRVSAQPKRNPRATHDAAALSIQRGPAGDGLPVLRDTVPRRAGHLVLPRRPDGLGITAACAD